MRASLHSRRLANLAVPALLLCAFAAAADAPPVLRPHDLMIGRITYSQNGQNVRQVQVGITVTIACNYIVNEAAGPFVFAIQPWQGNIQVGGQPAQNFGFQGDPRGGQHEARILWTPTAVGKAPISCLLNPGHPRGSGRVGQANRGAATRERACAHSQRHDRRSERLSERSRRSSGSGRQDNHHHP